MIKTHTRSDYIALAIGPVILVGILILMGRPIFSVILAGILAYVLGLAFSSMFMTYMQNKEKKEIENEINKKRL